MNRAEVYSLIDGERDYQDKLGPDRTDYVKRTVGDYLTMLTVYLRRAQDDWTNNSGNIQSLDEIRKIAGIAVHCMEDYGAPARGEYESNRPWDTHPHKKGGPYDFRVPADFLPNLYLTEELIMKYKTDINIILDCSGSMGMGEIYNATLVGYNNFLKQQKEVKDSARINFYQFNTYRTTVYQDVDINVAPELTRETFRPAGGTALLDAVGKTIDDVGNRLRKMAEADRPEQVLVVVITDGEENSSRIFTKEQVEEKVKHQTDVYKWQFAYIGANLEAINAGRQYGSYGSNQIDQMQLTSGGILTTPGEYIVSAFNKLGKSSRSYRDSNVQQVDSLVSLDVTDDKQNAAEVRELLGRNGSK